MGASFLFPDILAEPGRVHRSRSVYRIRTIHRLRAMHAGRGDTRDVCPATGDGLRTLLPKPLDVGILPAVKCQRAPRARSPSLLPAPAARELRAASDRTKPQTCRRVLP